MFYMVTLTLGLQQTLKIDKGKKLKECPKSEAFGDWVSTLTCHKITLRVGSHYVPIFLKQKCINQMVSKLGLV